MSLYVKYIDVPEGAQEDAAVTVSDGQPFSSAADIPDGAAETAWATLEPNVWVLDGSRQIVADNGDGVGWWSEEASNADGVFTNPPVIELVFSEVYVSTGLTFNFAPDEWCSGVRVVWYNGQTLMAESTVHPDSAEWVLEQLIEGFDRIVITLLRTSQPFRYAKLRLLTIGRIVTLGEEELTRVDLLNEIDPSLSDLSVDTMTVHVHDRSNRLYEPQENQVMELYRNGNLLAVQYITQSGRESNANYTFTCQSAVGLLGDEFMGGMYTAYPAQNLLEEILEGFSLELDAVYSGATITGYLPICTRREALQQVAFALGAVVSTLGRHGFKLYAPGENVTGVFAASRIFSGAEINTSARIARVDVVAHSYSAGTESETLVDNEEIRGESVRLLFDDPHHTYTVTGGTLVASGVNWVTITADGPVTVTGLKYNHYTAVSARRNASSTAMERNNVLTVDDCTLIHSGNVAAVLERVYKVSAMRQLLTQEVVVDGQKAGDMVSSINPWGTQTRGYLASVDSTFTSTSHTATVKIIGVGVKPAPVYHYAGELYAGDTGLPY